MRLKRFAIVLAAAGLALAAGLGLFALRYSHAAAWRLAAEERRWVERALPAGAAAFGMTPDEYRRVTRPSLFRRPGEVCVSLRGHYRDEGGSFVACFDEASGRMVSERAIGHGLGGASLLDPLRALVW